MSTFAIAITPVIAKIVMKFYLGPEAADIGGTALNVALKKLGDRKSATDAEGYVRKVASAIVSDLDDWMTKELRGESEEFWALELADSLEAQFSVGLAVECALDSDRISNHIVSARQSDWHLSGAHAAATMANLVSMACKLLTRAAPSLQDYELTRDSQILSSLEIVSAKIESILSGNHELLSGASDISSPEMLWSTYEARYLDAISSHLDYVEILGLDLRPERRVTRLSVAYLSLTVASGSADVEDERATFEEILQNVPENDNRLIIEGGAGSGKSTVLRWTAIRCAKPSKFEADVSLARHENPIVEEDAKVAGTDASNIQLNRLVPFLVRLRDLKDKTLPPIEELPRLVFPSGPSPAGWVENLLGSSRAILLFDGVDEVSEERGARARLLGQIEVLSNTYPKSVMIIAGRPGAFSRSPFGAGVGLQVQVNEMDDEERDEFISRWHRARAEQLKSPSEQEKIVEYAGRLKSELTRNAALRRMAANPLLAASICALHEINPSTTPRTEYELCERLSRMLISERDLTEDYTGVPVDLEALGRAYSIEYADKQTIISRIAGQMLSTGESVLGWTEARAVVEDALYRVNRAHGVRPDSMLKSLELRSGVIRSAVSKNNVDIDKAIEFIHNRFKEWFAAIYFLDKGQHSELANKLPDDPNDQVALFAVSATGTEDFANKLVAKVRERIEAPASRNGINLRQMKLVAVRLNEAARQLSPELKAWAVSLHSEMFPPRSKTEARALALLGDAAVPFLRRNSNWGARETAAAAFCLRHVGSPAAMAQLENYTADRRWTVGQEVALAIDPIRCAGVVARINSRQKIDRNTRSRITELTNVPSNVSYLNLSGSSLRSLGGIQRCANLGYLDISRTKVLDIKPIAKLGKINYINASFSPIGDISSLSGMENIKSFIGSDIKIKEAAPLSGLNIDFLELSGNPIVDPEVVGTLLRLSNLHMARCGLDNIEFIGNLTKLQSLSVSGNNTLRDLAPIRRLGSVITLQASAMKSVDMSTLGQVDSLRQLTMAGYIGADLTGIGNYQLEWILVDASMVADIGLIGMYKNLKRFDADNTSIGDISPLLDCPSLETLYLTGVPDIDEDVILRIPKLKELHVSFDATLQLDKIAQKGVNITYH